MNAIEIRQVGKVYANFAMSGVDLELPKGTVLGVVGENGAGKSTLIKMIMGAVQPDIGEIKVLGSSAEDHAVKNKIGYVPDEPFIPDNFTAQEVNKVMAGIFDNWSEDEFKKWLQRFNLPINSKCGSFSRGMKMKLSIATALSHGAELLVLDEATGGLDPMVRDEILDVFNRFAEDENHTVLLSSHIVSDLEKICDYILFIHKGRVVFFREKDALCEQYAIVSLPLEELETLPEEAVLGVRKNAFGAQALVERSKINPGFKTQKVSLEDIILFIVRGEE